MLRDVQEAMALTFGWGLGTKELMYEPLAKLFFQKTPNY